MISRCINLTWKTALQAANVLIFQHTGEYLSDLEIIILHGAWNNYTYEQIAEAEGYTGSYLCRDIGCKLWENLSTALKVKVSKTNFRAALQREWQKYTQAILSQDRNRLAKLLSTDNITLFEGLVALGDTFYLERYVPLASLKDSSHRYSMSSSDVISYYPLRQGWEPQNRTARSPIEKICYETIAKPGSLIRIEGAKWMGKTSLIDRILEQGNLQGQKTVYLDFNSVEREIIQDIDKLLRWLSIMVSHKLNLPNKVIDCWDKSILETNNNCTTYFEEHILAKTKNDVVLALDNIDRLFNYKEVTRQFLKLLCDWHEKGKNYDCWSRLKLIVTQSTKASIPFDIGYVFLNMGIPLLLEEFDFQQVKTLADFYQLDWDDYEIFRLMNEVGGHPYFVRLAMYQAKTQNIVLRH